MTLLQGLIGPSLLSLTAISGASSEHWLRGYNNEQETLLELTGGWLRQDVKKNNKDTC